MSVPPSLSEQSSAGAPLLVLIVPAVIIGMALIGAFVWGARRRAARARPPEPVDRDLGPNPDSWRVAGTGEGPAGPTAAGRGTQRNPGPPQ